MICKAYWTLVIVLFELDAAGTKHGWVLPEQFREGHRNEDAHQERRVHILLQLDVLTDQLPEIGVVQSDLQRTLRLLSNSLAEPHLSSQGNDVDDDVELSEQVQVFHDIAMVFAVVGALDHEGLLIGIEGTGFEDLLQLEQQVLEGDFGVKDTLQLSQMGHDLEGVDGEGHSLRADAFMHH